MSREDEIRARLEAVTTAWEAPWSAGPATHGDPGNGPMFIQLVDAHGHAIAEFNYDAYGDIASWLAANAPADIGHLFDLLDAERIENQRLREALREATELFRWLDRRGGLGLEAHERIDAFLKAGEA